MKMKLIDYNFFKKRKTICNIFLLIFCITIFASGCARTVTAKLFPVEDIQIIFTCRQTISTQGYSYYIIFSDANSPALPYKQHYFFAPGEQFSQDRLDQQEGQTLNDYYTKYFSTWTDYISITDISQKPKLYKGPFSASSNETIHYNYSNQLYFNPDFTYQTTSLTFSLSNLTINTNKINITILSVYKQTGQIIDMLTLNSFTKESGNDLTGTGVENSTISASANFKAWRIRIY